MAAGDLRLDGELAKSNKCCPERRDNLAELGFQRAPRWRLTRMTFSGECENLRVQPRHHRRRIERRDSLRGPTGSRGGLSRLE